MAMNEELKALRMVTSARFDMASAAYRALIDQERGLLAEVDALDAQVRASFNLASQHSLRVLGGDALFQGWANARRADLQMQIARIRAQQEPLKADLVRAFGRDEALRRILEELPK
jgi:hypothetical protein